MASISTEIFRAVPIRYLAKITFEVIVSPIFSSNISASFLVLLDQSVTRPTASQFVGELYGCYAKDLTNCLAVNLGKVRVGVGNNADSGNGIRQMNGV